MADSDLDAVWDVDCTQALYGIPIVNVNEKIRVTNGNRLFSGLQGVVEMNLSNLDVSGVEDMSYMFSHSSGDSSLNYLDLSGWDTSNVTDMSHMFEFCFVLETLNLRGWNISKVTDMSYMFDHCRNLRTVDVSNWDTSNVTNMDGMFFHCFNLRNLDVSSWNTSNVTNMQNMFHYCYRLKNLDVGNWNVSNVTNMSNLFAQCHSVIEIDVSHWDTSKVTNMADLFYLCRSVKYLDVSSWNVSNVAGNKNSIGGPEGMEGMFSCCYSLTSLDVSNWDVSNVTNMSAMFSSTYSLKSLNLSNWNVSNVNRMGHMFQNCTGLTNLNISNWDVSNVEVMEYMFAGCKLLPTLDLGSWNISNVWDIMGMFSGCESLTSLNIAGWNTSNIPHSQEMFHNCTSLNSLTLGQNTLNKNIFETLPQYNDTWFYTVEGTAATNPLPLGSVRKDASLFTDYDYTTMAGTWKRSTVDDPITVSITGHSDFFAYDGEEHGVSGYDVSIDHPLYSETDFEFTGTDEVKRTDVGISYMGLKKSDFVNKSDQFQNVTFLVSDGYVEITNGSDREENAVLEHVNQDGSKGAPIDLEENLFSLTVTIKDSERSWKSREISLNTADLTGQKRTDLPLVFPGSLRTLSSEFEVLLSGLPKYLTGIEDIYGLDQPQEHKYFLSYEAWINSEGKIEIVLFWTDERHKPQEEEELFIIGLPEDEIGAYAERPDGTREYLIFQTYDICMNYLGSEELCYGNERCYHK